MKTLYFDIDGTVLVDDDGHVKAELGGGKLESAVRDAGVERLVCVGNFVSIARMMLETDGDYDALGVMLELCQGAFVDPGWFRGATELVERPEERVRHIGQMPCGANEHLHRVAPGEVVAHEHEAPLPQHLGSEAR